MPVCEGRLIKEQKTQQCINPAFLQIATDDEDESATWLCKKCAKNFMKKTDWFGVFDDGRVPNINQ
jgi:hypothetical protein